MESSGTASVRRAWAAFQEGGVDSFLLHVHEDAELRPAMVGDGTTLHGHDEIRRWFAGVVDDGRRVESILYGAERRDEHVLVHGGLRVIAQSGLSDTQVFWLVELRGDRIRRAESFASRARALAALERASGAAA